MEKNENYRNLLNYLIQEEEKARGYKPNKSYSPKEYFQIKTKCEQQIEEMEKNDDPLLQQFGVETDNKASNSPARKEEKKNEDAKKKDDTDSDKAKKEFQQKVNTEEYKFKTKMSLVYNRLKDDLKKFDRNFQRDFGRVTTIAGVRGFGGSAVSSGMFGKVFGTASNIISGVFGLSGSLFSGATSFIGSGISLIGGGLGSLSAFLPGIGGISNIALSLLGKGAGGLFSALGGMGGFALSGLGSALGGGVGLLGSALSMPGNLLGGTAAAPLIGILSLLNNFNKYKNGERFKGIENMMPGGLSLDKFKDMSLDDILDFTSGLGGILTMFPETSGFGISLLFTAEIAKYIKEKWTDILGKAKHLFQKVFNISDKDFDSGVQKIRKIFTYIQETYPTVKKKFFLYLNTTKKYYEYSKTLFFRVKDFIENPKENLQYLLGTYFGGAVYYGVTYSAESIKKIYDSLKWIQKNLIWESNPIKKMEGPNGESFEESEKYVKEHLGEGTLKHFFMKTVPSIFDFIKKGVSIFTPREAGAATIPPGYFDAKPSMATLQSTLNTSASQIVTPKPTIPATSVQEAPAPVGTPTAEKPSIGASSTENNIGNMRASATSFQQFSSLEEGVAGMTRLLGFKKDKGQYRYNQKSLREIGYIWAPPNENNTEKWIRVVSKVSGFDPNQKLDLQDPDILKRVIRGIGTIEKGSKKMKSISDESLQKGIDLGISGKEHDKFVASETQSTKSAAPSMLEDLYSLFSSTFKGISSQEFIDSLMVDMRSNMTPTANEVEDYNKMMDLPSRQNGLTKKILEGLFNPLAEALNSNLKGVSAEITNLNVNYFKMRDERQNQNSDMDPMENIVAGILSFMQF